MPASSSKQGNFIGACSCVDAGTLQQQLHHLQVAIRRRLPKCVAVDTRILHQPLHSCSLPALSSDAESDVAQGRRVDARVSQQAVNYLNITVPARCSEGAISNRRRRNLVRWQRQQWRHNACVFFECSFL